MQRVKDVASSDVLVKWLLRVILDGSVRTTVRSLADLPKMEAIRSEMRRDGAHSLR